jgi:hypothetical protein
LVQIAGGAVYLPLAPRLNARQDQIVNGVEVTAAQLFAHNALGFRGDIDAHDDVLTSSVYKDRDLSADELAAASRTA